MVLTRGHSGLSARVGITGFRQRDSGTTLRDQADELAVAAADDASVRGGTLVAEALAMIAARMVDAEGELGRIDAVAGDGDHGRGMVKGTTAATGAADAVRGAGGRHRVGTDGRWPSLGGQGRRDLRRAVGRRAFGRWTTPW